MAQDGMENSTTTVADGHEDRFVLVGASFAGFSVGGGEDGEVFGRAAHFGIQLVARMPPLQGQAFDDGVFGLAGFDEEFVLSAVGAAGTT